MDPGRRLRLLGREDRVFVLDRAAGAIRFGDGRTADPGAGRRHPETALSTVEYTLGGGVVGNGGMTGNWSGTGGAVERHGGEPGARRRRRGSGDDRAGPRPGRRGAGRGAPGGHRRRPRDDRAAPRGWRWRAVTSRRGAPRYPCTVVPAVTVQVVPGVAARRRRLGPAGYDAALRPDPGVLSPVRAMLAAARLLGTELFVRPPRYRRGAAGGAERGARGPGRGARRRPGRAAPLPRPAARRRRRGRLAVRRAAAAVGAAARHPGRAR